MSPGPDRPRAGRDRLRRAADSLRRVLRIARWESAHTVGALDRRTAVAGVLAVVVAGAILGAAASTGGVAVDRGIYRVGVSPDSPYHPVVDETTSLAATEASLDALGAGETDLVVLGDRVVVADTRQGQAALAAFRDAVTRYNDRQMAAEENQTAAFPVVVTLTYRERDTESTGDGVGGAGGGDDGTGDSDPGAERGSGDGASAGSADAGAGGDLPVPDVGGAGGLFATETSGSPADISPPFPFASLVLAFAFLVPMNFVIQAYGSTVLNERINRRGELLLVAPVSPGEIVAGKTLPYLLVMLAATSVIAVAVGGGPVAVAAVAPVALLFLAATFVGGMFARSFKELTFVTVTVSVFLTTYTFVPAIFTNVTPIALISPLTLVVIDLQGGGVTPVQYLFATGPFVFAAAVLFLLGAGVYREEDMFTQRPVPLKFLDALDSRIASRRSVATVSALLIPFVFIAELLAVALLFALPVEVSLPALLVVVALVEEVAKSVHIYAGFAKSRFERTATTAVALGCLSGLGFFLGEKLTAVVQLVGLPDLALGRAAFQPAGVEAGAAVGLLLAPLALHAVTASISALGASRDRTWYAGALVVAVAVHALYNLAVVVHLG